MQMIIYGEGGTGKSKVLQSVTEAFHQHGAHHMLLKAAYTGVAASLIDGKTTHVIGGVSLSSGLASGETTMKQKRNLKCSGSKSNTFLWMKCPCWQRFFLLFSLAKASVWPHLAQISVPSLDRTGVQRGPKDAALINYRKSKQYDSWFFNSPMETRSISNPLTCSSQTMEWWGASQSLSKER